MSGPPTWSTSASKALREAARPTAPEPLILPDVKRRRSRWAAFWQGPVSDLGNPKLAIFFASLLPQFVSPGGASVAALTLLGIVFAGMTFAWLAPYAVVLAKLGDRLRLPAVRRAIEAMTGTLLIGLGVRIAADQG